jgi:peptidoglycan/xylan/chitin deacetylase (PgdA/CDA1 family)
MRLFQERKLPMTVFGCALALERHKPAANAIRASGFDVCCHGWRWIKVRSFVVQQVRPAGTAPAEAVIGLDSQEAAITADNYRAGLAPKGGTVEAEPTVIVAPPSREQPTRLAPSVPKE